MGEGGGKGGRMLPAYIGTVINSLGNLGVMGAGLYHAEKTMWDINSPQAMANQMIAKDIYETRTITKGLAGTIGSVGGGIVGAIAGGGAGSLVGSYLGGQIMAPIGEMVATFLTASKEAQQKLFNTIFGKAQGNVACVQRGSIARIHACRQRRRRHELPGVRGEVRTLAHGGAATWHSVHGGVGRGRRGHVPGLD